MVAPSPKFKEALQRAGRFCALRERSPSEVIEKVQSWGYSTNDAEEVVAKLIEMNYINEQRFANAYCHDKFEFNSWGKQKIKAAIYQHHLPSEVIENALNRIDSERYEARLLEIAQKKWQKLKSELPTKKKQKTVNYLTGKGYEIHLIWKTIDHLEKT